MKRLHDIKENLKVEDMASAARRAFRGHTGDKDVKAFTVEFDKRCAGLYNALMDGSWAGKVEYRKMEKTNNNGKRRKIDSPSLETRIYQHLFLNLVEPHYEKRDNLNGVNCKKGFGITAKVPSHSVVHRLKHIYYDRRYLHYALVIDQRECYAHITEKAFRRFLKRLVDDRWFVDFAVKVCFVEGRLPIGTPASPMVHHIIMLEFDYFVKTLSKASVRYADDNFLAFATKEEANAAKWRIKNWWWYNLGIRAKRQAATIMPLREAKDFCGYVFHRNGNRKACDHDKGYVSIREQTRKRASLCRNGKSWAAYFGLMKHADCYNLMLSIEKRMKLNALTQKIRIDRQMDAKHMDVKDLVGR